MAASELTRLLEPPEDPFLEEGDESHVDVTCSIGLFDDQMVASQSKTQNESQGPSEASDNRKRYSNLEHGERAGDGPTSAAAEPQ